MKMIFDPSAPSMELSKNCKRQHFPVALDDIRLPTNTSTLVSLATVGWRGWSSLCHTFWASCEVLSDERLARLLSERPSKEALRGSLSSAFFFFFFGGSCVWLGFGFSGLWVIGVCFFGLKLRIVEVLCCG